MDLHIMPYPPSVLEEGIEEEEVFEQAHIQYWRSVLDKIENGFIPWELFLTHYDADWLSHPAAWLSTRQNQQTLLHLATIANQFPLCEVLSSSALLRTKRNRFGQTPLDIAQYLHRTELFKVFSREKTPAFCQQPNVAFYDLEQNLPLLEFEYLPYPIFENYETLKEIIQGAQRAKQQDEIPTEKVWMGIYYDAEIRKQLNPAISIRFIDSEVGFGAYAEQRIPACAFVGEYTGIVKERNPHHLKDKYYCVRYPSWQMGKRKFVIDAEKKGNFTRYINHSNKPNLSLQSVFCKGMPRMIFIAVQEIAEGVQLTFDYGDIFWKECSQIPRDFE